MQMALQTHSNCSLFFTIVSRLLFITKFDNCVSFAPLITILSYKLKDEICINYFYVVNEAG